MQYSLNLLKKFINIHADIKDVANKLTLKTCEIEEIKSRVIPQDIVIGRVTKVEKHPDADKLNICQVDCGSKGNYQIVTGAENIKADIFVPVSLPGSFLPAINIKIEPRKMRGVESNGMICSKEELGINEDMELHGIWILEDDFDDVEMADLGKPLSQKYPWIENHILDVDNKTLTHRPDLTGHFGLSIELNSIYGSDQIKFNKVADYISDFRNTNIFETLENSSKTKVGLDVQTDGVLTYVLLEINNVNIKKSDFFSRLLMLDSGSNPRNNWVDFSNLFMNISSQPIHFFDADKINGKIIVRNAKSGEQFTDLFDKTHTLLESDIVIADESKILALAGVVGGKDSGVTDTTQNILVEIANFDSVRVRKTGTRLSLRTDAELRFEKHINPLFSLYSTLLFLDELKFFAKSLGDHKVNGLNYYIASEVHKIAGKTIQVNYEDMEKFIFGDVIEGFDGKAKQILKDLGYEVKDGYVVVPCWRSPDDMNIFADIYEEVTRIYGYENISSKEISGNVLNVSYSADVETNRKIEQTLVSNFRFDQVETYPFVDEKLLDMFEVDKSKLFKLQNPIAPELAHMRDNMMYNLLLFIEKNFRFFDDIKIFDIGKIWTDNKITSAYTPDYTGEITALGMICYQKSIKNWEEDNMLYVKGVVNGLLSSLGLEGKVDYIPTSDNRYHPKKQGKILFNGEEIGLLNILHPIYFDKFDLPEKAQISFCQLNVTKLKQLMANKKMKMGLAEYETLQDQIIYRDLSFVIDRTDNYSKITDAVLNVKDIKGLEVFDIYAGENLPEDKKSIAIKIKIIGDGKMTTEAINSIMNNAIAEVEKVGGKLRG